MGADGGGPEANDTGSDFQNWPLRSNHGGGESDLQQDEKENAQACGRVAKNPGPGYERWKLGL